MVETYLADGWEFNMATIVLDTTTKSLEIKLGEAKDTTEVNASITWADSTSNGTALAEGSTQTTSNGATAATICVAPAASTKRIVRDGEFYNADAISHIIYVQIHSNSTIYIIGKATVAAGASCTLDSIIGSAALGYSAPKLDDCAAPDDNTDLNASTSAHGLVVKPVAPAANLMNVPGIVNGETAWSNKPLFDATNPTTDGTAAPGTAVTAAHRDHVHGVLKLDDCAAPDNNTDLNASTTAHGLLLQATAPAANILNVVGIANGETVYANKPLFDATAPAALGTAAAGTSLSAAHRDHVHPLIRYTISQLNSTTALSTSDATYFRIPSGLNGMNLVSVSGSNGTGAAGASSSGNPTFTVRNVTDNAQMLSTSLTIDATEYSSATAVTPAVIDTSKDDVVTDDLIEIAVTTSGTGTTYATVTLGWQLP